MKNRITSILDMSNKKAGTIIIFIALIITLGTGAVFAANAVTSSSPSQDSEISLTMVSSDIFEVYRDFGLVYDANADELYYHGETVRYFEDLIPLIYVAQDTTYGIMHFSENGSVDLYTVRDFSIVEHNPNGTTDHSGVLLGIEKLSQVEFDARDIDLLQNQNSIAHADISADFDGEYLHIGNFGDTTTIRSASADDHEPYALTAENTVYTSNTTMPGGLTVAERLVVYESYGITFNGNIGNGGQGNIYYQEQLVCVLIDDTAEKMMTITSTDRSGSINIRILRDVNGDISGVELLEI